MPCLDHALPDSDPGMVEHIVLLDDMRMGEAGQEALGLVG